MFKKGLLVIYFMVFVGEIWNYFRKFGDLDMW